jgi:FlaA1/EpsC-like NDP-sugar epimerase
MTVTEAVELTIQAGAMGTGGDVFVLDMGKPVKIKELAEKMIQLSGLHVKDELHTDGDIEIIYTGLRAGEKLYEELLCDNENMVPTEDNNIMKLNHEEYDFKTLIPKIEKLSKIRSNDFYKILLLMKSIVPEFKREGND